MKNCPKCGKELKDTAKFCGGCGCKLEETAPIAQQAAENVCQKCGNPLKPGAKFCPKCGAKQDIASPAPQPAAPNAPTDSTVPDMRTIGSFIQWNILPGQLAVKIDENDISKYGRVQAIKGVSIQAGLRALLLVSGKVVAQLEAGSYAFKDFGAGEINTTTVVTEAPDVVCPNCGFALKPGAKFCPKCGVRNDITAGNAKAMATKEQAKGFWSGLCSAVGGAVASVWNRITGREAAQQAATAGLTTRISVNVPPVAIVLIRATDFPLVFDFKSVNTASIRSDVGLHILCKINNINDFYANMLLDRKMVTFTNIAQTLAPLFEKEINLALANVSPETVVNNGRLQEQLLPRLQALMPGVFPFLSVEHILSLSSSQADLDNLRKLDEELYVSEQELAQAMKRNEFLNRMQTARNEQELTELRTGYAHDLTKSHMESEFEASKEKIYEEMALTQDERAKFDMMLQAQRQLREAKSQDEVETAMLEFEKSGLLRQQELDNLRHQIEQDKQLRDLDDAQVLALATMNNQHAIEQQRMEWEIMMGRRRLEDTLEIQRMKDDFEIDRRRKQDNYSDTRRDADAQFEDGRRRSQINLNAEERRTSMDLDAQEQQNQLAALRQAQEIRNAREEAEHRRDMEAAAAARQAALDDKRLDMEAEQARLSAEALKEKQRLEAENDKTRIYAGMTVEQIMAANPDISEHAARALEAKFKNEAAVEAEKAKAQMAQENAQQMNAFLQQQMQQQAQNSEINDQRRREDTQRMQDMMMQMMQMNNQQNMQQMQMMRDQVTAFAGADHRTQQQLLDAKQQELDHARADAAASSDRFVDGMKTTINAVGNMGPAQFIPVQPTYIPPQNAPTRSAYEPAPQQPVPPQPAPQQPSPKAAPAGPVCPKCGAKLESGAMFCDECGEALS